MIKNKGGFTLIELIIVASILGILAAIAIPKYADAIEKANLGATLGNLATLRSAVSMYYSGYFALPSTIDVEQCSEMREIIGESMPYVKVRRPILNSPYGKNVTVGISHPTSMDSGWYYNNKNGSVYINSIANDVQGYCYTIY
jgi:prepilin-type N-terminal cleavage/methylation domain-containing protein